MLLIVRALSDAELASLARAARQRGLAIVAEAHDEAEIERAAALAPDVIGVNSRNLATFETDVGRLESLARAPPAGPDSVWRRAASAAARTSSASRPPGTGPSSIGEHLLRSEDPEEFLRALRS